MGCCGLSSSITHLIGKGVFNDLVPPPVPADESVEAPDATRDINTIFYNFNFLLATGDSDKKVSAVAVTGGIITDVGDATTILEKKSPITKVINLEGATLSPGFVESHVHVIAAVQEIYSEDLRSCQTYKDVLQAIHAKSAQAKPGSVGFLFQFRPLATRVDTGRGLSLPRFR
jgi:predicted amidohydrolase YtcJ